MLRAFSVPAAVERSLQARRVRTRAVTRGRPRAKFGVTAQVHTLSLRGNRLRALDARTRAVTRRRGAF